MSAYPSIKRFLKNYVPEHKPVYALGVIFLLLTIAILAYLPRLLGDAVTLLEKGIWGDEIFYLALKIFFLGLGLAVFRSLSRIFIFRPGRKIEDSLRCDFYDALLTLPKKEAQRWNSGDLITAAITDTASARVLISMGILHSINTFVTVGVCLVMMCQLSVRLTIISLVPLFLLVPLVRFISQRLMKRTKATQLALVEMTETIREQFRSHLLMAVYPVYSLINAKGAKKADDLSQNQEELMFLRVCIMLSIGLSAGLGVFSLLYFGIAPLVQEANFDRNATGLFVSFAFYLAVIQHPLRAAGFMLPLIQRGEIALGRIYAVIDVAETWEQAQSVLDAKSCEPKLEPLLSLKEIDFAYESEGFRLKIDNWQIEENKTYGVFGATGSGKTTLLSLLRAELILDSGEITYKEQNLDSLRESEVRDIFANVFQENRHFSRTIEENLQMMQKGDALSIEDALEVSCFAKDINQLEDGLQSVLGERGINLSGGQKQRLAIARALVRDAEIYVFDDFVSAVDYQTEREILASLKNFFLDKTAILVSHRTSALQACDEILVLDEGMVSHRGTHEELLQDCPFYAKIHSYQSLENEFLEEGLR